MCLLLHKVRQQSSRLVMRTTCLNSTRYNIVDNSSRKHIHPKPSNCLSKFRHFSLVPLGNASRQDMRLINTTTLQLDEFFGNRVPASYAILSHTWEDEEVTFQEWQDANEATKLKSGYQKIERACQQAKRHSLPYLWADTNCIDKTSSAELSEAINSMFSWYKNATTCYAYLYDVGPAPTEAEFSESKWFTRGWTLQELLAPTHLVFYASDWSSIGTGLKLAQAVSSATRINKRYLYGDSSFRDASVATKMSWVSTRTTSRIEDIAYCMVGIFDINMPLLYGEGSKAFVRLQEEIIKVSNDQTIFCWTWTEAVPNDWVSMLAPCHQAFKDSGRYTFNSNSVSTTRTYGLTNAGLSMTLQLLQTSSSYLAVLEAGITHGEDPHWNRRAGIPLHCVYGDPSQRSPLCMRRGYFPQGPVPIEAMDNYTTVEAYIQTKSLARWPQLQSTPTMASPSQHAVLLVFDDTFPLRTWVCKPRLAIKYMIKEPDISLALDRGFNVMSFSQDMCHFQRNKGSLIFQDVEKHPAALVAIGNGKDISVFFIGLMQQAEGRKSLVFCRPLAASTWKNKRSMETALHEETRNMIMSYEGGTAIARNWKEVNQSVWTVSNANHSVGNTSNWQWLLMRILGRRLSRIQVLRLTGPFFNGNNLVSVLYLFQSPW